MSNEDEESLKANPSLSFMLWGYLAPSRNRFELELMIRHPLAYPPLFSLATTSLPVDSLLRPLRITASRQDADRFVYLTYDLVALVRSRPGQ
jgi:hypothetical protein